MPLTQEQRDKIAPKWRKSKGIENCVACGFAGGMLYGDVAMLLRADTVIGEAGPGNVGVVPIACPNCGYTMLFDEQSLPL